MDLDALLQKFKDNPYEDLRIETPTCGLILFEGQIAEQPAFKRQRFCTKDGMSVQRRTDDGGTALYAIQSEGNTVPMYSSVDGQVAELQESRRGRWCEAGTHVMTVRHFLTRAEISERVLQEVLRIYHAPDDAKYSFLPELSARIERDGCGKALIRHDEEILIKARMKREETLRYDGEDGVVYGVYFVDHQDKKKGEPLLGICLPAIVPDIEKVVKAIKEMEWKYG